MSLIEINKVLEADKKDRSGSYITDPVSKSHVPDFHIKSELISLDLIRSARHWNKGPKHSTIESDLTLLYMKNSDPDAEDKGKKNTIIIAENYEKFTKRCKAIRLNEE